MERKFIKKQALLTVVLGAEFEMFELSGPNGAVLLLTQDVDELINFIRETPDNEK